MEKFTLSCLILGYLAIVEFRLTQAVDAADAYAWLHTGSLLPAIAAHASFVIFYFEEINLMMRD